MKTMTREQIIEALIENQLDRIDSYEGFEEACASMLRHGTPAYENMTDGELMNSYMDDISDEEDITMGETTPEITYRDLAIMMGGKGDFSGGGTESIDVKASLLRSLVRRYPNMFNLQRTQNESPSIANFLEVAEDEDILLTYVVSDTREDKRVSIEGIITESKDVALDLIKDRPDEYDEDNGQYRLWWD